MTEADKRVIAWMESMLGIRISYVDKDPSGQRRVRDGLVTKIYSYLMLANIKLADGTAVDAARPSHVDVKYGIEGVHCHYFFPASGEWP